MGTLLSVSLIVLCSVVLWKACSQFERSSKILGHRLEDGVRGATINAIASSLPELFTSLFFLFWIKDIAGFAAGIATVIGSAIFNILLIPACVIFILLKNGHNATINKRLILRDSGVLILSQVCLLLFIQNGRITAFEGLALMFIYAGFIANLSRYGLFKNTSPEPTHNLRRKRALAVILRSVLMVSAGCFLLVWACELLGAEHFPEYLHFLGNLSGLGWNPMLIALVFAAAASSVPDLFISCIDAKNGDTEDSISNPIASNLFDICVAFGFPLALYTMLNGGIEIPQNGLFSLDDLTKLMLLMLGVTVLFLVIVMTSNTYRYVHMLLLGIAYGTFVYLAFHLDMLSLPQFLQHVQP